MTHSFDVDIATRYGINAAILLQNFHFWVEHNRANETNYHDGYYWTYNSVKAFSELFPYMSEHQIRTAIEKLIDEGLILKGNHSHNQHDRTTWYTVTKKGVNAINHNNNTDEINETPIHTYGNPFADNDEPLDRDTVEAYASKNLYKLSPGNMQEFVSYKDELPDELIRYAIDEACSNGKPSWSYTRAILNAMIDRRFKTVKEAKAAAEEKKRRKQMREQQPQQSGDNLLLNAPFIR